MKIKCGTCKKIDKKLYESKFADIDKVCIDCLLKEMILTINDLTQETALLQVRINHLENMQGIF